MNGDIALYEIRVKHPEETFMHRGRNRPNGKKSTCVHRLLVSAFSRESAESLARFHCFKKLGKHVDTVDVCEIDGRVHDLGMFAYPTKTMGYFRMNCAAQAKKEEESCQ